MEIRHVDPREHDALGALTVDAYAATFDEPLGGYEVELRDVEGRATDSVVLVALDDDATVLGGVTYVPDAGRAMSEFDDPDAAGIRMLAVRPDAQGRGIGRALVAACVRRAKGEGRSRVVLHSTPAMVTALALYQSMGFVRDPDRDVFVTEQPFGEDAPLHLVAYVLTI